MELGAKKWHTTIETSLNVPFDYIERLYPYVDDYIIDIKDMNAQIYASYTGRDNKQVVSNLKRMINDGLSSKMRCRVPLIPGYNDTHGQEVNAIELRNMGITRMDMFDYQKKE
jgi:pyruvate formate lyase activating enzyme